jgi:hypothetical protein
LVREKLTMFAAAAQFKYNVFLFRCAERSEPIRP